MQSPTVDQPGRGLTDSDHGGGGDPRAGVLSLAPAELFRVTDAIQIEPFGQDHRGGDHRSRERASTRLVHPGNADEPLRSQAPLVTVQVRRQWIHPARESGHTIANALPITLSIGT